MTINLRRPPDRYSPRDESRRNLDIEQADRQNWKLTSDVQHRHSLLLGRAAKDQNMARGLQLDAEGNDNAVIILKDSEDVATGYSGTAFEGDTFCEIRKNNAAEGGLSIAGVAEDASLSAAVVGISAYGGDPSTTLATTTIGLQDRYAAEHDGAGNLANVKAFGVVYSWRCRRSGTSEALMLLTQQGTLWLDGSLTTSGPITTPIAEVSTNTTLDGSDDFVAVDASSAAVTITLPAIAGIAGLEYTIKKIDSSANAVTVDGNGSETIDGATTYTLASQWDSVTVKARSATGWFVK